MSIYLPCHEFELILPSEDDIHRAMIAVMRYMHDASRAPGKPTFFDHQRIGYMPTLIGQRSSIDETATD